MVRVSAVVARAQCGGQVEKLPAVDIASAEGAICYILSDEPVECSGVIIATVLRSRASGIPHIVAPAFEAASRFNALGRALALEGLDQYCNTSFCALSEGHGVFCWGAVTRGIGGGIEMREVHFPASVALLSVSELEACVVTTNGQVLCANAPVFGDGRVWQVFDRGGWTRVLSDWRAHVGSSGGSGI